MAPPLPKLLQFPKSGVRVGSLSPLEKWICTSVWTLTAVALSRGLTLTTRVGSLATIGDHAMHTTPTDRLSAPDRQVLSGMDGLRRAKQRHHGLGARRYQA